MSLDWLEKVLKGTGVVSPLEFPSVDGVNSQREISWMNEIIQFIRKTGASRFCGSAGGSVVSFHEN